MPSIPLPHAPESAPRLRGDLGVWLIILAELLTFGIFFVSYAFARSRDVVGFNAAQATLDLHSGAFNTVLLITPKGTEAWPRMKKEDVAAKLAARIAEALA